LLRQLLGKEMAAIDRLPSIRSHQRCRTPRDLPWSAYHMANGPFTLHSPSPSQEAAVP